MVNPTQENLVTSPFPLAALSLDNCLYILGPYKSAPTAALQPLQLPRVNWKIGKIYFTKCKS